MENRKEEIARVHKIIADAEIKHDCKLIPYSMAEILVDEGVRTKKGFECETCYGEGLGDSIKPINYKDK